MLNNQGLAALETATPEVDFGRLDCAADAVDQAVEPFAVAVCQDPALLAPRYNRGLVRWRQGSGGAEDLVREIEGAAVPVVHPDLLQPLMAQIYIEAARGRPAPLQWAAPLN